MIALLAARLEESRLDDLALGADVLDCLLYLPEFDGADVLVPFMGGLLDSLPLAKLFVQTLLPARRFVVADVFGDDRWFSAHVEGRDEFLFSARARSEERALLAAALRAYDDATSSRPPVEFVADNTNAPAFRYRVAEAAE